MKGSDETCQRFHYFADCSTRPTFRNPFHVTYANLVRDLCFFQISFQHLAFKFEFDTNPAQLEGDGAAKPRALRGGDPAVDRHAE